MKISIIKLNSKFNYENIFEIEYDENITIDFIKNKFCEKNEIENSFIIHNGIIFSRNENTIYLKQIQNLLLEKYLIIFINDFKHLKNDDKLKYQILNLLFNTINQYSGIQNTQIIENENNIVNYNINENIENSINDTNEINLVDSISDVSENITEQNINILNSFINIQNSIVNNKYSEQIKYLESIGFTNKELNEEALIINDGDIEKSVNYLIDLNLIIL